MISKNYKKVAKGEKDIQYTTARPAEYSIQTNLSFIPSRIFCQIYRCDNNAFENIKRPSFVMDSGVHNASNQAADGNGEYGYFVNGGISKAAFKIVLDSDYTKGYFRVKWLAIS